MTKYCFDIDGTICVTPGSDYPRSVPVAERIALVNSIYEQGHTVVFFTARGSTTGNDWRELTESQLAQWGVKYHELIMGKPSADLYIDDKGRNDVEFFSSLK